MALSNAEKQHRRRERLKAQGLIHVQGWVTPAQAEAINAIMQGKPAAYRPEDQPVTYHQPAAPAAEPAQEPAPPKRSGTGTRTAQEKRHRPEPADHREMEAGGRETHPERPERDPGSFQRAYPL